MLLTVGRLSSLAFFKVYVCLKTPPQAKPDWWWQAHLKQGLRVLVATMSIRTPLKMSPYGNNDHLSVSSFSSFRNLGAAQLGGADTSNGGVTCGWG